MERHAYVTAYRTATPVAQSVCDSVWYWRRRTITPPQTSPKPERKPMVIRNAGEIRLLSNEYLTNSASPKNSASPPNHANSFTPMKCSQFIPGAVASAGMNRGRGSKAGLDGGLGGL